MYRQSNKTIVDLPAIVKKAIYDETGQTIVRYINVREDEEALVKQILLDTVVNPTSQIYLSGKRGNGTKVDRVRYLQNLRQEFIGTDKFYTAYNNVPYTVLNVYGQPVKRYCNMRAYSDDVYSIRVDEFDNMGYNKASTTYFAKLPNVPNIHKRTN